MKPDSELIDLSLKGHREAYCELIQRYERAVFAAAGAILGNCHDVQDAAQEAFLQAYRDLRQLRDKTAFGAWIIRIGQTQALKVLRKARPTVPLDDAMTQTHSANRQLGPQTQEVLNAVAKLTPGQQQTVLLRFFGGMSVSEIAEVTGQPPGTVTSQLSRAYQNLREHLKEIST